MWIGVDKPGGCDCCWTTGTTATCPLAFNFKFDNFDVFVVIVAVGTGAAIVVVGLLLDAVSTL